MLLGYQSNRYSAVDGGIEEGSYVGRVHVFLAFEEAFVNNKDGM